MQLFKNGPHRDQAGTMLPHGPSTVSSVCETERLVKTSDVVELMHVKQLTWLTYNIWSCNETWLDEQYVGHIGHTQRGGTNGPRRPMSAKHGQNGLSHAHVAY